MIEMPISTLTVTGHLVLDERARGEWCKLPYGKRKCDDKPTHPKGCPNYGKKAECPPFAPLVGDFIDLSKNHWFIISRFDLASHVEKMKLKPRKDGKAWTEKQARCVLYWQKSVVNKLEAACVVFAKLEDLVYTLVPEAMGVHVIKTARQFNIPIKTRPTDTIYKIALVGYPKHGKKNVRSLFRKKRRK